MNTFVFKRASTKNWDYLVGEGANSQALFNLLLCERLFIKVFVHELVTGFCRDFDDVIMHLLAFVEHICWDFSIVKGHPLIAFVPIDRLHFDKVNHAFKGIF